MSYYLNQERRDHLVVERSHVGATWRAQRWDSFHLVTPNWMLQLPGFSYQGDDPGSFAPRARVVEYLEQYAHRVDPPLLAGVNIRRVTRGAGLGRYRIISDHMLGR